MLMSKSRLEKFLYALYSLDHSDLPTPLSRIEELYNCLVTGAEVPTFKPLSRVEKYLMAILGVYDVDSLPLPLSRVEVLLHKLATGDDNLDDIESFLSRHEELLAEIIRNGGIDGDISFDDVDYEYIKYLFATSQYTLENTAEQPIKSAVLKGQTLVNSVSLVNNVLISNGNSISSDRYITITANSDYSNAFLGCNAIKNSTKYLCILDIKEYTANSSFRLTSNHTTSIFNTTETIQQGSTGIHKFIFTTISDTSATKYSLRSYLSADSTSGHVIYRVMLIEYQEGMENWDIPYFEGMQSVQTPVLTTTGKNLFDGVISNNGNIDTTTGESGSGTRTISINFTAVLPDTTYTLTRPVAQGNTGMRYYNLDKVLIGTYAFFGYSDKYTATFTTPSDCYFVKFIDEANTTNVGYQIELGDIATEYEPYKSTTVTCNEEVELRGVGDFKDELDLLTGEVTRRTTEIVLDGSEDETIVLNTTKEITQVFKIEISSSLFSSGYNNIFISDRLSNNTSGDVEKFVPGIYSSGESLIYLALNKTTASTVSELREYLSKNPLTILGPAKNQTIETVKLATKDQDGNDIPKPKTFDNLTHVTITSEGLVRESEIEVAKYIPYMTYALTEKETTLYNTKEHSVKSAVLKGQTLVNLSPNKSVDYTVSAVFSYKQLFKIDTIYTIIYDVIANDNNANIMVDNIETEFYDTEMWSYYVDSSVGHHQMTFTYSGEHDNFNWWANPSDSRIIIDNIVILEGDYTNADIPYFEGMGSVKNPVVKTSGKNLFDGALELGGLDSATGLPNDGQSDRYRSVNYVKVKPNTSYIFSNNYNSTIGVREFDEEYGYSKIWYSLTTNVSTFTTSENTHFIRFIVINTYSDNQIQLEEGSVATEYEPYKSTTVTCNEDVELRKVEDVQDELDLVTGTVTRRTSVLELTGNEKFTHGTASGFSRFSLSLPDALLTTTRSKIVSNNFNCTDDDIQNSTHREYLGFISSGLLYLYCPNANSSTEFSNWLLENPTIIYYAASENTTETIGLISKDQDGNNTKLKSFEDITYVTLSSEGLIPESELEVATKNEEVLDTMSLEMDDIYATQTALEETSDTQSENVDSTMLATTEIYEGLL